MQLIAVEEKCALLLEFSGEGWIGVESPLLLAGWGVGFGLWCLGFGGEGLGSRVPRLGVRI